MDEGVNEIMYIPITFLRLVKTVQLCISQCSHTYLEIWKFSKVTLHLHNSLISLRNKHPVHVHVDLSAYVCSGCFLQRFAIKHQDEAGLAWIGVDD